MSAWRKRQYSKQSGPIGTTECEKHRRRVAIAADRRYLEAVWPLLDVEARRRALDVRLRAGDPAALLLLSG